MGVLLSEAYIYQFLEFSYNPAQGHLTHSGAEVPLGDLDRRLLQALLEAEGELVLAEDLRDTVWEGQVVGEDALKQRVRHLRTALKRPGADELIETVRGKGYRMAAPVTFSVVKKTTAVRKVLRIAGYVVGSIFVWAMIVGFYEGTYTPYRLANTAVYIEPVAIEQGDTVAYALAFDEALQVAMVERSGLGIMSDRVGADFRVTVTLKPRAKGYRGSVHVVGVSGGQILGLYRFDIASKKADLDALCVQVAENVATIIRGFPKPDSGP